ncbi:MAG TPA: homoserine dehydrogenase [Candidatus Limnocylindrales bacterium]|jgi:homoserine dehydrogenase|nr:homoserine dehydrogenase [Candidatus Limnocylindrales bacterium]
MSRPPLRVAVLGAGIVGRAVIDGLTQHPERLETADGREICLIAVAVRDIAKTRASGIPTSLLTDAPAHLVADPDINVIVELMGGIEPARTLIVAALGAGKAVVTANKAVVAHHGPELEAAARRSGAALRFEASVGGGIPVLGPIAAELAGNDITQIRGIVNGTTNYILTAMAEEGRSYDDVLRDAQERGYAEADPSGDVEGDDAVNKLVILSRLAFDEWLDPATVCRRPPTINGDGKPGITGVTDGEIEAATRLGLAIKLLATAGRGEAGIEAAVMPTAIPADSAFGRTSGVMNRIEIEAEPLGTVAFSGPGAGGAATSSAVLGDLVAVARGAGSIWAGRPAAHGPVASHGPFDRPRAWFTRTTDGAPMSSDAMALHDVRAMLASKMRDADAAIYPIDG